MATILNSEIITYNPAAIVNIFNNALTIEATKKAFRIRGIYLPGKGINYNRHYYDSLKDKSSDACVTLIVPGVMRHDLTPQQTIEFTGYLTKKVQANAGKIELHVNLIELLSQQQSKHSEEQIKDIRMLTHSSKLDSSAENCNRDYSSISQSRVVIIIVHRPFKPSRFLQ